MDSATDAGESVPSFPPVARPRFTATLVDSSWENDLGGIDREPLQMTTDTGDVHSVAHDVAVEGFRGRDRPPTPHGAFAKAADLRRVAFQQPNDRQPGEQWAKSVDNFVRYRRRQILGLGSGRRDVVNARGEQKNFFLVGKSALLDGEEPGRVALLVPSAAAPRSSTPIDAQHPERRVVLGERLPPLRHVTPADWSRHGVAAGELARQSGG